MSVGRLAALAVINGIWLLFNFSLSWQNLNWRKRERELFLQAEALVKQAEETLAQARSCEYKVCPTCGKIVQGVCLTCLQAVPSNAIEG
jgi:hypothetical protein